MASPLGWSQAAARSGLAGLPRPFRTFGRDDRTVKLIAADVALLSSLLDDALKVPPSERETWLAASLGATWIAWSHARELLAQEASRETGGLIDRLPSFTARGLRRRR